MKKNICLTLCLCIFTVLLQAAESPGDRSENWPHWRGPLANGIAEQSNPPTVWSETKNVKWKTEIPGEGHATPIIWGKQIFILTSIATDQSGDVKETLQSGRRRGKTTSKIHQFTVLSIDRNTGKTLWQKIAREELPHEGTHGTASWAPASPITDGEHLYAHFGSRGLYCYDLQGNLKWQRDFGDMKTRNSFGEGISPALHGDRLVINWDHEGQSFIVVVDKKTGKDIWKVERDEKTSWSTPYILEYQGKTQVIVTATNRVRSYDLDNGEIIWQCGGLGSNCIPMPVVANDMVYLMSGHRNSALIAVDLRKASGDITDTDAVIWRHDRDISYTPSPILTENKLYFLKRNDGILSCLNAKTGKPIFGPQRLEGMGSVYASPVLANGRIYIFDRSGTGKVIEQSAEFNLISTNKLEDGFSASPAIAGNEIFLRGHQYLYCISKK